MSRSCLSGQLFRSFISLRAIVTSVLLTCVGGITLAITQDPKPIPTTLCSGKAFLPGEISIGGDVSPIDNNVFTCTPVHLFKGGAKVPAVLETSQGKSTLWSVSNHSLPVGQNQALYADVAMVASSDGAGHGIAPAILKAKTDIKAGQIVRSEPYQIDSRRAVKAGDPVSVFVIIGNESFSLLSIEAGGDGKPWFAAFREDMKPAARASVMEVWRIAKQHVPFDPAAPCGK